MFILFRRGNPASRNLLICGVVGVGLIVRAGSKRSRAGVFLCSTAEGLFTDGGVHWPVAGTAIYPSTTEPFLDPGLEWGRYCIVSHPSSRGSSTGLHAQLTLMGEVSRAMKLFKPKLTLANRSGSIGKTAAMGEFQDGGKQTG